MYSSWAASSGPRSLAVVPLVAIHALVTGFAVASCSCRPCRLPRARGVPNCRPCRPLLPFLPRAPACDDLEDASTRPGQECRSPPVRLCWFVTSCLTFTTGSSGSYTCNSVDGLRKTFLCGGWGGGGGGPEVFLTRLRARLSDCGAVGGLPRRRAAAQARRRLFEVSGGLAGSSQGCLSSHGFAGISTCSGSGCSLAGRALRTGGLRDLAALRAKFPLDSLVQLVVE